MNKGRAWVAPNPQHSDDAWAMAREMNAQRPGNGEWVPKQAVAVPDWQVRTLHEDKVQEYRDVSDLLPPLRVQQDTFVLIDGRHRLFAEPSDCVRIVEEAIADEDVFLEQIRANAAHGLPYTQEEKRRLIKEILTRYPTWSDARIATTVGCHRQTVLSLRPKPSLVENRHVGTSITPREGKDGRVQNTSRIGQSASPRPAARSFDPGPDAESEEPVAVAWERHKKPPENVDTDTGEIVPEEEEQEDESLPGSFLLDGVAWRAETVRGVLLPMSTEKAKRIREAGHREWDRYCDGLTL